MSVLRLALPTPVRRLFDYLPPADTGTDVAQLTAGVRVQVPFGNRQLIGLLIEVVAESDIAPSKLKPAIAVLDNAAPLPKHLFDLARWAANYYQHPHGDALQQALPVLLRKGEPCQYQQELYWFAASDADAERLSAQARKQREVLQLLLDQPQGIHADELRTAGGNSQVLKALQEKELIESRYKQPQPWYQGQSDVLKETPLSLNPQQQTAVDSVAHSDGFSCSLIEGITGSGKTEVYLQIIESILTAGKQALVLVPEIGLTPQTVTRFKQRFDVPIVVLHSNMTDKQRLQAWLEARDGIAAVIIGTRSALFTPLMHPGVIIIDEEHDASFKQQEGFRYSARDLAIARANWEKIPVVLGTATPALESLWNAKQGRYQHLRLTQRAGNAKPPHFELLDIRQQPLTDGLSTKLIRRIAETLEQGNQVLVFVNRRGFAPTLSCQHCGAIEDCRRCDAHMTLHMKPPHLHCHHCDSQRPVPRQCSSCGSTELKPVGSGTERSEHLLEKLFPETPVIRVDRDSTSRKDSLAKIMQQVHTGEPCILVGTQMLAKGHHFSDVTLVAILNADGGLFSADFRGMERTAQLIVQVAGRAGRAEKPGQVLMQTMHADHPAIGQLVENGYHAFANDEILSRQQVGLPPFSHLALLKAEANKQGRAEALLRAVREQLEHQGLMPANVRAIGPFPSTMERKAGVYRAQLQFQSPQRAALQPFLAQLCQFLEQQPEARKVRWIIDVDPIDMS